MAQGLWQQAGIVGVGLLTTAAMQAGAAAGATREGTVYLQSQLLPEAPVLNFSPEATPDSSQPEPALQAGSSGPGVVAVQQQLTQLGHYAAAIDGRYGAATAAAVAAFQRQQGLIVDGVVGADTWASLRAVRAAPSRLNRVRLPAIAPPTFSLLTPTLPPPPPSPFWILVMPMVPLVGGALTYLSRCAQSKPPFSSALGKTAKKSRLPRRLR